MPQHDRRNEERRDTPPERGGRTDGDLSRRIRAAKERQTATRTGGKRGASYSGIGLGLRIATEMVSSLAVGVVIGIVLDRWLSTQPLFLILFFILGAAAAFTNLIRQARAYDREREAERTAGDADRGAGSSRDEEG